MAVAKLFFCVVTVLHTVWCHRGATKHGNLGIIGGHEISIQQVPFMASLRVNGTHHWCGGSIIHERYILTAAHCIERTHEYKIIVGTDKISGDGELYDIEEIKIHNKYDNQTRDFDICLIKLQKALIFGPKVNKIKLADSNLHLWHGLKLKTTGWGFTGSNQPLSPNLMQVVVPFISWQQCMNRYSYIPHYTFTKHMICAGSRGRASCQRGDSGGPLTHGDVQVGVTSFEVNCGLQPSVYAKVSTALPWITDQMH